MRIAHGIADTLRITAFPAALVIVLGIITQSQGGATRQAGITGAVFVTIVVGLYMFSGNCGIISIAHVAFVEVGAYVTALLTMPKLIKQQVVPHMPSGLRSLTVPFSLAALIAMVCAGVLAAVAAVFLMRLGGLQSAVATFSLLLGVDTVVGNWRTFTAGPSPLYGIPIHTTMTVAVFVAVLAIVAAALFQRSHLCLRLRATREEEVAAVGAGVNFVADRRLAFIASGMLCGLGGALYSSTIGIVTPDGFGLKMTFLVLAMLIIGGLRSLAGAVIGAAVVTALTQTLLTVENGTDFFGMHVKGPVGLTDVGLGVVFLLILLIRPSGLTGGREPALPGIKKFNTRRHFHEADA